MISFGVKKPSNGPFISRVRRWVEGALPAEHKDTVVMVNEVQCFEPVRALCRHTAVPMRQYGRRRFPRTAVAEWSAG
jgi:hypothetical protein